MVTHHPRSCSSPAPSEVPTLRLHSSSGSSLTLSWAPPEWPNGVILDYEMKYFEKVRVSVGSKGLVVTPR